MAASRSSSLACALGVVALAITLGGCGRKGGLEVPGGIAQPNPVTLEPAVRPGDTLVTSADTAPPLRRPVAAEAELRASDIRGANADAPETGDAVPEGPTDGAVVPDRPFLLDALL